MADMIPTADMEYYLKTGVSTFTKLENLKDFSPSADKQTYERKYKDRVNTSEVVTGVKYSFEAEVELEESGTLHTFLETNEDALNVPTEIVRVKKFRPGVDASGNPTTSYEARKAAFVLNVDPIDGSAGEFLAVKLTLGMTDEAWTAGTFDTATSTFTPGA